MRKREDGSKTNCYSRQTSVTFRQPTMKDATIENSFRKISHKFKTSFNSLKSKKEKLLRPKILKPIDKKKKYDSN